MILIDIQSVKNTLSGKVNVNSSTFTLVSQFEILLVGAASLHVTHRTKGTSGNALLAHNFLDLVESPVVDLYVGAGEVCDIAGLYAEYFSKYKLMDPKIDRIYMVGPSEGFRYSITSLMLSYNGVEYDGNYILPDSNCEPKKFDTVIKVT